MKRCLTSSVITEMQVKTTEISLYPTIMVKRKVNKLIIVENKCW